LYPNTGTFEWSNITLKNFTGNANGERIVEIYCSKAAPCFDWHFEDINIKPNGTEHPEVNYVCNNMVMDWENGLDACHTGEPGYQSEQFFWQATPGAVWAGKAEKRTTDRTVKCSLKP
jgi:galacturan 1,4-alpha-galacturonidase